MNNTVLGHASAIPSGDSNLMASDACFGSINGGMLNRIEMGNDFSTVLNGRGNRVGANFGVASGERNRVDGEFGVAVGRANSVAGRHSMAVGSGLAVNAANQLQVQGTVKSARMKQYADSRIMSNHRTTNGATNLAIIASMRVVDYDYSDDLCRHWGSDGCAAGMTGRIGVIAQEAAGVNPSSVDADGDHLTIEDTFSFEAFGGRAGSVSAGVKAKVYAAYAQDETQLIKDVLTADELASVPAAYWAIPGSVRGEMRDGSAVAGGAGAAASYLTHTVQVRAAGPAQRGRAESECARRRSTDARALRRNPHARRSSTTSSCTGSRCPRARWRTCSAWTPTSSCTRPSRPSRSSTSASCCSTTTHGPRCARARGGGRRPRRRGARG